ncbi:MAG: ATP-binding protein [Alteromonadaceae bacterium]|nr:MAG: ATP-binding protein [Alteromonadaceae bacterium]
MPRKLFKRWTPDPKKIQSNPNLKFLGNILHHQHLFHLNRHSVSVAFFVGLFTAFLPIPGQMLIAAFGAFVFRCNLPIAVSLIWISNPFTFPIIFYATYKFGQMLLQLPERQFSMSLSWEWITGDFLYIWQPLVLGCLVAGLFFGCLGYLFIQWSWRWHVIKRWNDRKNPQNTRSDS